jgi:hypothetical protein
MNKNFRRLLWILAFIALGSMTASCNTTDATTDTVSKFSSSTSPSDLFTLDGLIKEEQKLNLFVGVGFESLRQNIASGKGEYLASLEHLLRISPRHHVEFAEFAQGHYDALFTSDFSSDRQAHLTTVANLERVLRTEGRLAQWQH